MREKLEAGDCLDVLAEGEELAPGLYRLRRFLEGVDYCDAAREAWIWSIGQHVSTGEIIAATDARFYQNPEYVCLFLR
jgi:hypothetical protein